MGTNYYVIQNHCEHCGRGDRIHIGKSSAGWTFSFRGYMSTYDSEGQGIMITSYRDWLEYLPDKRIEDEYGEQFTLQSFQDIIESKRSSARNHTVESRLNNWTDEKDCWLDDGGNSFSGTCFS